jgi:peroxiredoxin
MDVTYFATCTICVPLYVHYHQEITIQVVDHICLVALLQSFDDFWMRRRV